MLIKVVFPVGYLVALILCLGFKYALLLLSLLYTTTHLQVLLIPKTNLIGNEKWLLSKMILLYYKTHACIFQYNNAEYSYNNDNVTYLIESSLCMVTLSL